VRQSEICCIVVRTLLAATMSAGLLLPLAASAESSGFELTPFVAQRVGGSFEDSDSGTKYDLDSSSSYGFLLGMPWESNSQLELYYSKQSTDLDDAGFISGGDKIGIDLDTLQIGGSVFLEPRGKVIPFFSGTFGGTRIKPDGPGTKSDTFFSASLGGGWKYFPTDKFGLRLEGRFIGVLIDSNSKIFCASGPGGSGCIINSSGDVLWQFEAQAGVIFRF